MKKTLIMLSVCFFFFGCTRDWGTPTTRNYPINGTYTGLDISNAFHVTVSDQVQDVVVTVGDLAHEKVLVKVIDGMLHIGFKPHTSYNGEATAIIPVSIICDLELSGASSFKGDLSGTEVDIDLSGASFFKGNIVAHDVDIELSGASSAILNGLCQSNMELEISGASKLEAAHFNAPSIHGNMSGASNADVTCCTSLNVDLSGASTLTYGTYSDECHPNINCPASGGSVVRPRR